jgi:Kef-type K+ transport system membrane component KefB
VAAGGGPGLSVGGVAAILGKAVLFLGATVGLGHVLSGPIVRLVGRTGHPGMLLIVGLALCFTLAFVAEWVGLTPASGTSSPGRPGGG